MIQHPPSAIGADQQLARLADALHVHIDLIFDDRLRNAQDDAAILVRVVLEFELRRNAERGIDHETVGLVGCRREGEGGEPLIDAGLLLVGEGLHAGDLVVLRINESALKRRRLVRRSAGLHIDAVRHAGYQIASFGVEIDMQIAGRRRNRFLVEPGSWPAIDAEGSLFLVEAVIDFVHEKGVPSAGEVGGQGESRLCEGIAGGRRRGLSTVRGWA